MKNEFVIRGTLTGRTPQQATPNAEYETFLRESLINQRERTFAAEAALYTSSKETRAERRLRRVYQVLALLGWAAVVVMGVFYG